MTGPVDRAALRQMADQLGGWEVVEELLEEYVGGARESVEAMEEAVEAGDAEALRSEAHGLKGSSLQMNVEGVADLCLQLEEAGEEGDLDGAEDLVRETRETLDEALDILEEMEEA